MNTYEAVVILTTKISDEEREAVQAKISDLITKSG
jgi:ribosomal protein S6